MTSPSRRRPSSTTSLVSTLALCVITAALSAFTFGFHLGEVNQPRDAMSNCPAGYASTSSGSLPDCIPMDDWAWGTFVSVFLLGGTIGGLSGGSLVTSLGRRRVLFLNNIPFLLSSFLLSTSSSATGLYFGRFVAGLAAGLGTVAVPLYIAEVAPVSIRGQLGAVNQLAIVIGILFSQSIGIPLSTRENWRTLFAWGAASPLIQCALLPFCVESPRWLQANGLMADARKALFKLRSESGATESQIDEEFESLVSSSGDSGSRRQQDDESGLLDSRESAPLTTGSNPRTVTISDLFTVPSLRKPLIACIGIQITQQFSGINAATFYSTTIFNQSYSPEVAIQLSLLVSLINVIMTVVSMALIEKLGRKTLLLTSELGMMGTSFLIYLAVKIGLPPSIIVIALMGFVGFFGVGLGAITWLILPELIPGYAVNAAVSVCSGTNWGASWTVAFFLPAVIGYLGYDVFLVFGVLLAGFASFTNTYVPETKGLTPEEVARINHF